MRSGACGDVPSANGVDAWITKLPEGAGDGLHAVTDLVIPGGKGDRLVHVWMKDDELVQRSTDVDPKAEGATGTIRLRSSLSSDAIPEDVAGQWAIRVETLDGQLVGRVRFEVID